MTVQSSHYYPSGGTMATAQLTTHWSHARPSRVHRTYFPIVLGAIYFVALQTLGAAVALGARVQRIDDYTLKVSVAHAYGYGAAIGTVGWIALIVAFVWYWKHN